VRIVILKFNHLGDNVVFVPVVQAIRQLRPDWEITLLTTPNEAALYHGKWGPQEIIVSPKEKFDRSFRRPWDLARWIWTVRKCKPDACLISFDQGTVAHLVAKLSGARIRVGGNLSDIKVGGSLTHEVTLPADGRPATWHWEMARTLVGALGMKDEWPAHPPAPELSHLLGGGVRVPRARKQVVIHSGASRPINQWPIERFEAVAVSLAKDFEVLWIMHGGTTGPAPEGTTSVTVTTLGELADLQHGADLFLGNNSGPMHLANALGCRGVAVTGPSASGWDPYWYRERWSVLRHPNLYCAPCEKANKALAGCINLMEPMACMAYWTAGKVEDACRSNLAQSTA